MAGKAPDVSLRGDFLCASARGRLAVRSSANLDALQFSQEPSDSNLIEGKLGSGVRPTDGAQNRFSHTDATRWSNDPDASSGPSGRYARSPACELVREDSCCG